MSASSPESTDALPPWPPSNGLSTQIISRSQVTHDMHGSILIHAPASLVWELVRDTSTYPAWNTFTPRAHITSQPSAPTSSTTSSTPSASEKASNGGKEAQTELSPILQISTRFTFDVVMDPKRPDSITPTQLRVTDISIPPSYFASTTTTSSESDPTHTSSPSISSYIPQSTLSTDGSFHADLNRVYRIAWTAEGKFVQMGLKGERISEIIVLDPVGSTVKGSEDDAENEEIEERCIYRSWECQGGTLARIVKWKFHQVLLDRFASNAADLKREAERIWAEERKKRKNARSNRVQ